MSGIVAGVFNLLRVTFLAGLMLAYDWFLGSLCLGLIALRLVVVQVVRKPVRQQVAAELTARGEEAGALSDAATAIELAKGLGIERGLLARYAHRVRARARWSIASGRLQSLAARVLGVLGAAMYGVILWFGGGKVIAGETTVGVYVGFLAIWALLEAPILSLVDLAEGWARARGLLERCDDILGVPAPKRGTHVPSAPPEGRLEVRNLGFRYGSGSPWLFRKVSFTVEPGEHVCIAGASGEGKSTLGMLLVGLLEPTEGDVLLDGTSVRDYSAASFARHVGVVQQTPVIFEGTVFDNLRLRRPEAGIDDVRRAAALAELDGVIQRLPDRYGERLQPLGRNLSGGERQRVAIAQALLDSPALVLLDEATSALDRELEAKILGNLAALGSTLVSIAHRAAMLEGADRLLLVHAGSVTPARSTRGEPLHAGHAPASGSEEAAACPAR